MYPITASAKIWIPNTGCPSSGDGYFFTSMSLAIGVQGCLRSVSGWAQTIRGAWDFPQFVQRLIHVKSGHLGDDPEQDAAKFAVIDGMEFIAVADEHIR